MSKPLTLFKLRSLLRLYHPGIEGAVDELNHVLNVHWDVLPRVLRSSPEVLAWVRNQDNPADALASAIEASADSPRARAEEARIAARGGGPHARRRSAFTSRARLPAGALLAASARAVAGWRGSLVRPAQRRRH